MKNSILISIFLALFLSGCVSITKELPAYKSYSLKVNKSNLSSTKINYSIKVKEPKILNSLNTPNINYSTGNRFESYALSRWSDTPSHMIQRQMVKYLSKYGNYKFVSSSKINVRSDYALISEIDEFEQFFKSDEAFVRFNARIYLKGGHNDLYVKNFEYIKKCDTKDAKGAVDGMNKIMGEYVSDLNMFIVESLK